MAVPLRAEFAMEDEGSREVSKRVSNKYICAH